MRLNKDHKKSHIIGKLKVPYSLNEPFFRRKKWVDEHDTKKLEEYATGFFVMFLRNIERRKVLYSSPNPDDDHKNPDTYVHLDGKLDGIQIVQLTLNNHLTNFNQTKRLCEDISRFITNEYKPPIKINIQIYPPWETERPPKFSTKMRKKVAKEIAATMEKNIQILKEKKEYLNFELDRKIFGKVADSFNLYPIPSSYHSTFFGDNNVYIDYEFDAIQISEEDIISACNKIYSDKNGGNSEILLIWGDKNHFMGTESLIIDNLKQRFQTTTFKSVYFLAFHNLLDVQERIYNCEKII
ncbi:hypothetical protein APR41_05540 [Salegentibacter salinarum]|uniref:Uncharacterized protein n=1 Tax=Salegentibacter salinarum TaxID=447422 RepID=A0A2N0TSF9_9FLAO|nr:hypothetical protein [Salegentibacter salinarum]PKD17672.1 hypothetical protein APR41_05540 [Salegentibacter salinarum]SKB50736.1 hypothetical protein SAMN05660903_01132 [Salegentibacter salinarum]